MIPPSFDVHKLLRSKKLALFLFLALALVSVYGTLSATEQARAFYLKGFGEHFLPLGRFLGLVDTYHSPIFIALFLLLLLNIALCSWQRFAGLGRAHDGAPGGRRRFIRWLDLILHLSILVILAGGAAKGALGFIGTKNIHVGLSTDVVFDWSREADVPLGFTIHLKDRVDEYYSGEFKIGVSVAETGEKIGLLQVKEGERTALPGGTGSIEVVKFDRRDWLLEMRVVYEGREELVVFEVKEGGDTTGGIGPFSVTLVAWRQDLKTVRSLVAIEEGGKIVKEGWLTPNGRVAYKGTSLFQTAWGIDEYRNPYTGIQVTRDPGAPLFWAGCILFSLALPLYLAVRHRR